MIILKVVAGNIFDKIVEIIRELNDQRLGVFWLLGSQSFDVVFEWVVGNLVLGHVIDVHFFTCQIMDLLLLLSDVDKIHGLV